MARKSLAQADVWLIGLFALLVYAATAAPGIAELFDDSLEFQLVAPTFAIAHPPATRSTPLWAVCTAVSSSRLATGPGA